MDFKKIFNYAICGLLTCSMSSAESYAVKKNGAKKKAHVIKLKKIHRREHNTEASLIKNNKPDGIQEIRNSIKIILLNEKKQILLMCTDDKTITNKDGSYNGKFWQLIGGKIEKGEEVIDAAKRELFEETSLTSDKVEFGPIVWYGNLVLNMKGKKTLIKQKFILANTKETNVSLQNLTDEEKPVVKFLQWMSIDDISKCEDIVYPIGLEEILPGVVNDFKLRNPIYIDLSRKPSKK